MPLAWKKKKKDIQHPRFPCSPLPKYWSGPTVLNFAVRMGCGAFTVVWPYDEGCAEKSYSGLKTKKIKKKKSFESFFFFFSRPEHSWPFIRLSHQASLPNVRCSIPKFDSKILITWSALIWGIYTRPGVRLLMGVGFKKIKNRAGAPTVGLEPTTTRLRVLRSTNWARRDERSPGSGAPDLQEATRRARNALSTGASI